MDMDWEKIVGVIRERKLNGEQGLRVIEKEWQNQREEREAELEARRADLEARRAYLEASRADLEASSAEREAKHAAVLEAYAREKRELELQLRLAQAKQAKEGIGQNDRRSIEISSGDINVSDFQSSVSAEQRVSEPASGANEISLLSNKKTKGSHVTDRDSKATVNELHVRDVEEGKEVENATPPDNKEPKDSSSLMSMPLEGRSSQRSRDVGVEKSKVNGMSQKHSGKCVKVKGTPIALKAPKTGCNYQHARTAAQVSGRRVRRKGRNAAKTRKMGFGDLDADREVQETSVGHKCMTQHRKVVRKRRRVKRNRGISLSVRPRHWAANRRRKKQKKTRNVKKHRLKHHV